MIVLSETTDNLQVVLTGAVTTNQLQCTTSWRERTATTFLAGRTVIDTNDTTDVNIVASPSGASTQRLVDFINIFNKDTATAEVTVKFDANGTEYILWKGSLTTGQALTYVEGIGWSVITTSNSVGFCINVQALSSTPADGATVFFGALPKAPVSFAGSSKLYIPKDCILKRAEIYTYSGTAGSAEGWSLYVRHQDTTDYLIATLATATNQRIFSNSAIDIAVSEGDFVEIKGIQPTWATNPATTIYGGYLYFE